MQLLEIRFVCLQTRADGCKVQNPGQQRLLMAAAGYQWSHRHAQQQQQHDSCSTQHMCPSVTGIECAIPAGVQQLPYAGASSLAAHPHVLMNGGAQREQSPAQRGNALRHADTACWSACLPSVQRAEARGGQLSWSVASCGTSSSSRALQGVWLAWLAVADVRPCSHSQPVSEQHQGCSARSMPCNLEVTNAVVAQAVRDADGVAAAGISFIAAIKRVLDWAVLVSPLPQCSSCRCPSGTAGLHAGDSSVPLLHTAGLGGCLLTRGLYHAYTLWCCGILAELIRLDAHLSPPPSCGV